MNEEIENIAKILIKIDHFSFFFRFLFVCSSGLFRHIIESDAPINFQDTMENF
jgi:hypothetical protein